jgi:hypothetical protein
MNLLIHCLYPKFQPTRPCPCHEPRTTHHTSRQQSQLARSCVPCAQPRSALGRRIPPNGAQPRVPHLCARVLLLLPCSALPLVFDQFYHGGLHAQGWSTSIYWLPHRIDGSVHTGVWPQFIGCRAQCHDGEDDMAAHEQKYLRFKVQTNTTHDIILFERVAQLASPMKDSAASWRQ